MQRFPETRISVVSALASADDNERERATGLVIAAYRSPVIAVLQRRWGMQAADAEDLAHDFFAHALDRDWLARYDPDKGRFRTFLRTCLMSYASTSHEAATRQKRGGAVQHVSIDDVTPVAGAADVDAIFDREWTRSVLSMALESLQKDCMSQNHDVSWKVFSAYDVEGADGERPTYQDIASRVDIPLTQVTNHLNWARKRFRQHVLDTIRTLTATEAEYRDEVRALTGKAG